MTAVALALGATPATGATPAEAVPVMVRTAPGRIEVAAVDASVAHAVAALGGETWQALAGPLGLPDAFSSPLFLRVVRSDAAGGERLEGTVEPGGVVSVWIHTAGGGAPSRAGVRRAVVRGLLLRQAVALHGAGHPVVAPAWLEHAATGWCEVWSEAAGWDALRQESASLPPPALGEMLLWGADAPVSRPQAVSAIWLLQFFVSESRRSGEWPGFLRQLLGGAEPFSSLAAAFPGRFESPWERELWWQTGWHDLRRARTIPGLGAPESRTELERLARFVFARGEGDFVLPLREVLAQGGDAVVGAELRRRAAELGRVVAGLHPFYRNAGLSLAAAFEAVKLPPPKREAACALFEQDWRDATELEAASQAVLDRWERPGR